MEEKTKQPYIGFKQILKFRITFIQAQIEVVHIEQVVDEKPGGWKIKIISIYVKMHTLLLMHLKIPKK